jgi:hypothetical protein
MMKQKHISLFGAGFVMGALLFLGCDSGTNDPTDSMTLAIPSKGGKTFNVGDTVTVSWKPNSSISSVYFKMTTNPDSGWNETIINGSVPATDGQWKWVVGNEYFKQKISYPSNKCKMKILDYETLGATYRDSTGYFTVN